MTPLLSAGDDDVRALPATAAVQVMRDVLASAAEGRLLAPPRVRAPDRPRLRLYRRPARRCDERLSRLPDGTACGRAADRGLGTGRRAPRGGGRRRARRSQDGGAGRGPADLLAREDASSLGIVGAGAQAWNQLWALLGVRALDDVRVYSRTPAGRDAFARRARGELGVEACPVDTSAEAIADADIVVLATTSRTPVIDAREIAPGTHVTTLGPKAESGHETPTELADAAGIVTCGSPAQAASYPEPFFTNDAELVDLAAVLTGRIPGRRARDEITLHCCSAGTEVALAARVLDALEGRG